MLAAANHKTPFFLCFVAGGQSQFTPRPLADDGVNRRSCRSGIGCRKRRPLSLSDDVFATRRLESRPGVTLSGAWWSISQVGPAAAWLGRQGGGGGLARGSEVRFGLAPPSPPPPLQGPSVAPCAPHASASLVASLGLAFPRSCGRDSRKWSACPCKNATSPPCI